MFYGDQRDVASRGLAGAEASTRSELPRISNGSERVTYAELLQRVERFTTSLAKAGIQQGDRIILRPEIAPYKYPRKVEFVETLPRTSIGKIRRVELREKEIAHEGTI